MTPEPGTGSSLQQRVGELADATWALASVSVALDKGMLRALEDGGDAHAIAQRTALPVQLVARLLDVLVALGAAERADDGRYRVAAGAEALLRDRAVGERVAAEARSALLQASELSARSRSGMLDLEGWQHEDPVLLRAQGTSSSGAVPALTAAFPDLGDLAERMQRPGATALDVGTGVAAIAIALCRRFPELRVVGLEPAKAPLTEARRNVAAAGMEHRVELRAQRVEDLADEAVFDFAFLPIVFLPTAALRSGLAAVLRALRPGGWVMMGSLGSPGDHLGPALARLKATLWGSEALPPEAVAALCEEAGFAEVRILAMPGAATLVPVAARRGA